MTVDGVAFAAFLSLLLTLVLMIVVVERGGAHLPILQSNGSILIAAVTMASVVFAIQPLLPFAAVLVLASLLYGGLIMLANVLPNREMLALWQA